MSVNYSHEDSSGNTVLSNYKIKAWSKKYPQYVAAGLATVSGMAAGSCLAWTSPALPMLAIQSSAVTNYPLQITDSQGSWAGSLITLGAFLGVLPARHLADKVGRKRVLLLLAVLLVVSWILIGFSGSVWGLFAGRLLAGFAVGAVSVTTPLYVSEVCEPKVRTSLGSLFQLQITIGILFEYIAGMVKHFSLLTVISGTIPVAFFIGFSFMPESPVFLYSKGRTNEAFKSLQWFRGNGVNIDEEISKIHEDILASKSQKPAMTDLVKSKATIKAMVISLGLMVFQQLSGINAVIFYAGKIFKNAGGILSPYPCAAVIGVVQVIATYCSFVLIDRAGRRFLLLISSVVMCLCLGTLGLYCHLQATWDMSGYSWIPLTSLSVYIAVLSVSYGPIPWILIGEIFPSHLKALVISIAVSLNWILAFLVTKSFQNMLDIVGTGWTFGYYSSVCFFGTIFVYALVPETKGKNFEDIQMELSFGRKRTNQLNSRTDEMTSET